jgi:hypothetical protein
MTQLNDMADLQALVAAIAASPIVVPASSKIAKARDFADWCALQGDVEIDTVILEWLRSHRPQPVAFS